MLCPCPRAIAIGIVAAVAIWSSASPAQTAPSATAPLPAAGETIQLTDAEREAILDRSTVESAAAARGELPLSGSVDPRIHGEVGVMIGSNGSRSEFGTAAIPLGEDAGAVVSFENSRWRGYPR